MEKDQGIKEETDLEDDKREEASGEVLNLGKVTSFMILSMILVFVAQQFLDLVPYLGFRLLNLSKRPWVIFTAAFLHGSFFHLAYNLFAIFFFSNAIEIHKGGEIVLICFLLSVIVGNLGFGFLRPQSYAIGASGFVYGLIGLAVLLLPNLEVVLPIGFVVLPLDIKYAGPLLAVGELILTFAKKDNVAHSAHFFGFFIGVALGVTKRLLNKR